MSLPPLSRTVSHRRSFVVLAAAAVAMPRLAMAQDDGRIRRIAILLSSPLKDPTVAVRFTALKTRLGQLGWVEGRTVAFDLRSSDGDPARRAALVRDMIATRPDILNTTTEIDTASVLRETHTIPVVFSTAADPVGAGLVQSLTRPGGNATGFTNSHPSMGSKWLEILKELAPNLTRVGVLFNPDSAPLRGAYYLEPLKQFSVGFGIEVAAMPVVDPAEIAARMSAFAGEPDGGIVVMPDSFTVSNRKAIVAAAAQSRLPTIYPYYFFMNEGGLISYGFSYESGVPEKSEVVMTMAEDMDLILRGANPAELPIRSPRLYELLINLKAAKALGLSVPPALLARADKVFE